MFTVNYVLDVEPQAHYVLYVDYEDGSCEVVKERTREAITNVVRTRLNSPTLVSLRLSCPGQI